MRVFCDFDGTITKIDVTDHILSRFADPSWENIEADWQAGRITAADCMRRQIALVRVPDADLEAELDRIELSEGFAGFVGWCAAEDIPLTVVSDGVDRFIQHVLTHHGLGHLPVISNRLAGQAMARMLEQPWHKIGCAAGAGVCKCAVVAAAAHDAAGPSVYVGDGRSDFCVSARCDILFAKSQLQLYAASRGQPHHAFVTLRDVHAQLAALRAGHGAVAV